MLRVLLGVCSLAILASMYAIFNLSGERAAEAAPTLNQILSDLEANNSSDFILNLHEVYHDDIDIVRNIEKLKRIQTNLKILGLRSNESIVFTSHRSASLPFFQKDSDVYIVHARYGDTKTIFNIGLIEGASEEYFIDRFSFSSNKAEEKISLRYTCDEENGIDRNCEERKHNK